MDETSHCSWSHLGDKKGAGENYDGIDNPSAAAVFRAGGDNADNDGYEDDDLISDVLLLKKDYVGLLLGQWKLIIG